MGWMKAIYTDIEELNERVLDIYAEDATDNPDDAIEPLGQYLSQTGWKSPTEMLALKQGITEHLSRIYGDNKAESAMARGDLMAELVSAFSIELDSFLPALPVPAASTL